MPRFTTTSAGVVQLQGSTGMALDGPLTVQGNSILVEGAPATLGTITPALGTSDLGTTTNRWRNAHISATQARQSSGVSAIFTGGLTADAGYRVVIRGDGGMYWGDGTSTATSSDAGIIRPEAGVLRAVGKLRPDDLELGLVRNAFPTAQGRPLIYGSLAASGGVIPFDQSGNLVLQAAGNPARSILLVTGASAAVRVVIDSAGRVLIGSTTVGSSVGSNGLMVVGASQFNSTLVASALYAGPAGAAQVGITVASTNMLFRAGGTDGLMRLLANGALLIGTTVEVGLTGGDLVLANNRYLRGVNTGASVSSPLIGRDASNRTLLGCNTAVLYVDSPVTAAAATAGANGAPPAQVAGYWRVSMDGVGVKFPYYLD